MTSGSEAAWRPCAGGLEIFVRLTPKSARDAVEGVAASADGRSHLKARVRAVPEKGQANAALERLLAAHLGVGVRQVSVVAGSTARLKTVHVVAEADEVARIVGLLTVSASEPG